jgi:hypothetical protein
VRRWPCWFMLIVLLAGCKGTNPFSGGAARTDQTPPPPVPASVTSRERQKQAGGVLAGRVVDAFRQPRPAAQLELLPLDAKPEEKPKQVTADAQGHFIIRGLEPGRKYKLTGRSRPGENPLQGTMFATPPNVVVLLTLNEDAPAGEQARPTSTSTDPSEGSPSGKSTGQGKQYLHEPDQGRNSRLPPTTVPSPDPMQPDAQSQAKPPAAQLGQPQEPNKPQTPPVNIRPDMITDKSSGQGPPTAQIPRPTPFQTQPSPSTPAPNGDRIPPTAEPNKGGDVGDEGQLRDLDGKPVSLSVLRGKLVLVDLWSTSSPSCVRSLREVVYLHKTFGQRGLEVVGVAYEDGPWNQKVERVKFVAGRQGADYSQWMGTGDNCPLLRQLDIQRIPTTLLLDENGKVIWRMERLTPESRALVEALLLQRLGAP